MKELIEKLKEEGCLSKEEFTLLIENRTQELAEYIFLQARKLQQKYYENHVYVRGLIEFTNYCKNNCYYCGIRKSNKEAVRYRIEKEEILSCCEVGYELGFRTFVLQGGEDLFYSDDKICEIVSEIKKLYKDCAVTLSIGEKSYDSYKAYYEAGADRYLLRHETFNNDHYLKLHPSSLSGENRKECLWNLKKIGYQTGTGFMVGSPYQTAENLAEDMLFIHKLNPHMVGIGPFIPHHATPFSDKKAGTLELTLYMLGLLRIMMPKILLPATTALGTIDPMGREKGILAGANVIMPNLSPVSVRKDYSLYDNKICMGAEAAEGRKELEDRMKKIGYEIVTDRGDMYGYNK